MGAKNQPHFVWLLPFETKSNRDPDGLDQGRDGDYGGNHRSLPFRPDANFPGLSPQAGDRLQAPKWSYSSTPLRSKPPNQTLVARGGKNHTKSSEKSKAPNRYN